MKSILALAWISVAAVLPAQINTVADSSNTTTTTVPSAARPEVLSLDTPPAPFSFKQRMEWAIRSAVRPRRFIGYAVSSGIGTWRNDPPEYGPHWDGFGRRMGLRASTGTTGLLMESALGTLWGEDPRYYRATGRPVKTRLMNVLGQTLLARDRHGKLMPAYARYIAFAGNSYLTNTWRPDSMTSTRDSLFRIQLGFISRLTANAIAEFAPDAMRALRRKKR